MIKRTKKTETMKGKIAVYNNGKSILPLAVVFNGWGFSRDEKIAINIMRATAHSNVKVVPCTVTYSL